MNWGWNLVGLGWDWSGGLGFKGFGTRAWQFGDKWPILDWESIRSSPRDGSSTSNWLTKGWLGFGGWLGVVGWVVGPQYFRVIPWHFENGASSRLMMFLLKMVDYSMSFLSLSTWIFFWWTSRVDHSGPFLFSELFCGTPPSCLKVMGGWVVVGGWWPTGF